MYYQKNDFQELVWGRGNKIGKEGQKVQTFSYKISESWGCNVQHGAYSRSTVLCIGTLLRGRS